MFVGKDYFFIAEVGQNHNGNLELAREFIRIFAFEGADAIKFQTRDNKTLFDKEAYEADYNSENAFAKSYGEHREKLELKPEWLPILKQDCIDHGVKFMSTPFDEPSLDLLIQTDVDIIKVASFDLGNLPFIYKVARAGKPVVISIGGGKEHQIKSSVEMLLKGGVEVAVLHCVSEYPCSYDRLGLGNIEVLIDRFPNCAIGSSDHFNGILSGPVAALMGSTVFEKHVTLNRASKGTDHSFALEPDGFRKFVRDVKRSKKMIPVKPAIDLGTEPVFKKLGKSIIASRDLQKGAIVGINDLSGRIFKEVYTPVRESSKFLGATLRVDVKAGDPIELGMLYEK